MFGDVTLDHVGFYVDDIDGQLAELVNGYGFAVYGAADRTVAVGRGEIRLLLTEPTAADHPGAAYLDRHGDGVADIALRVPDAAAAYAEALRRGAAPVRTPRRDHDLVTASIAGFGDVVHTFVQRPAGADPRGLPGLGLLPEAGEGPDAGLREVDHFAVCLEPGHLERTVAFYREVLDFRVIFTERIVVGSQAMNSQVVQSAGGGVTLTLIEPDTTRDAGQIDGFLAAHGGSGVQHIAFTTDDIVDSVASLRRNGVEFLAVPGAYYTMLAERIELRRHPVADLRALDLLVDSDHDGQLFQIFARSTHRRATLFYEVIERFGAHTFGSGNIKALYEAVERERTRERSDAAAR